MNEQYMNIAINEAEKAYKKDEVPVGCVIVKNNKVIAKAYNKKENKKDVTCHAEIQAIKKASKKLKTWHLDNCIIYVTLEPCMMCSGAIEQSRIKKIYFGTPNITGGFTNQIKNIEVVNLNIKKCEEMLKNFFKNKRK